MRRRQHLNMICELIYFAHKCVLQISERESAAFQGSRIRGSAQKTGEKSWQWSDGRSTHAVLPSRCATVLRGFSQAKIRVPQLKHHMLRSGRHGRCQHQCGRCQHQCHQCPCYRSCPCCRWCPWCQWYSARPDAGTRQALRQAKDFVSLHSVKQPTTSGAKHLKDQRSTRLKSFGTTEDKMQIEK